MNRSHGFLAVTAAALLLAAPAAWAQSAGTSYTGTSGGVQGTPAGAAGANGAAGVAGGGSNTMSNGVTTAPRPGDTTGASGALGGRTAEQHQKFGN